VSDVRTPRDLAHAWRDALMARDAEAFGRLFAADAVMVDVEHRAPDGRAARPLVGRDEIQAVAARWLRETGPFAYEVDDVLADERRAAVRWTYRVDVQPGRSLTLEGLSWLECGDGEIVRADVMFDVHALLAQGR
jgi:ketosteroid isomerase-like protein